LPPSGTTSSPPPRHGPPQTIESFREFLDEHQDDIIAL